MYDVEGFVTRNFDEYKYYGNPVSDIVICCPFCESRGSGEDTKFHLQIHINSSKQVVHCFRCDYGTSWVQFVMDVTGLPYWRAIGELYVKPKIRDIKSKIAVLDVIDEEAIIKEHALPEDFILLQKVNAKNSHLASVARKYLTLRGFIPKVWKKHNLGIADSIGYRVIIPIEQGYWQARALYKWMDPKYLNPKEPSRDLLFNADVLEIYDEVVICEGAFSAMAVGDNAMALISKEPTRERIARILDSDVKTFIIALEQHAYKSMSKLTEALRKDNRKVIIWKYIIGDPADKNGQFEEIDYDLKTHISFLLDI